METILRPPAKAGKPSKEKGDIKGKSKAKASRKKHKKKALKWKLKQKASKTKVERTVANSDEDKFECHSDSSLSSKSSSKSALSPKSSSNSISSSSSKSSFDFGSKSGSDAVKVSFKVITSFTLDILSSDTIGSIKDKFCKIEGSSINQRELFLAGNQLEDTKTLSDYILSTDSTVDIDVEGRIPIFINIPSMEKTLALNVNYMDTVQKLKAMIQDEVGLSLDQQLLVFRGKSLKGYQVLIACGVIKDSTIYVTLNPLAKLLLYVHMTCGNTFSLEVIAGCSILDVKVRVESLRGIPAKRQKILHNNVELQDSFTLSFYKIKHKSTLHMQHPMQIFVKIETGNTITITAEDTDTVALIMTKITSKIGFKSQHLKLVHAGKFLQEQNTLAFYGIQRESTIYLR